MTIRNGLSTYSRDIPILLERWENADSKYISSFLPLRPSIRATEVFVILRKKQKIQIFRKQSKKKRTLAWHTFENTDQYKYAVFHGKLEMNFSKHLIPRDLFTCRKENFQKFWFVKLVTFTPYLPSKSRAKI